MTEITAEYRCILRVILARDTK